MRWDDLAVAYGTDKASRWRGRPGHNYMRHYERLLGKVEVRSLLEIGVYQGASLRVWRDVLPGADIYGVDIDPGCRRYDDDRVTVFTADQANRGHMEAVADHGPFTVVIDDGSHDPADVLAAYETLGPVADWYFVEDLPAKQAGPVARELGGYMLSSCWPDNEFRMLIVRGNASGSA